MIADMAVNGFSPCDVRRWTLGEWMDVSRSFGRAYSTDDDGSHIPAPSVEELKKFKARGALN